MSDEAEVIDDADDRLLEVLRGHRSMLMEHFDSIQIIATKMTDGESASYISGAGCVYSRRGAVREWLIGEETACSQPAERDDKGDNDG